MDGADASQLHEYARSRGMRTLYEDGLKKVATGLVGLPVSEDGVGDLAAVSEAILNEIQVKAIDHVIDWLRKKLS